MEFGGLKRMEPLHIDPSMIRPVQPEKIPGAKVETEDFFSPVQQRLAQILNDAYTKQADYSELSRNEVEARSPEAAVTLPVSEHIKVIDSKSNTIEFEGHRFTLPEQFRTDSDSNSVSVLPGIPHGGRQIIGASPSTLAALGSGASNVKPATAPAQKSDLTPLFDRHAPPPPTKAQLAQEKQALANQQAAAERAAAQQSKAARQAAEMRAVTNSRKPVSKKTVTDNKQAPRTSNATLEAAAAIIGSDKAAKEAVAYARNTQQTTIVREKEANTAVLNSAERGGVAVVQATENAKNDTKRQNQQNQGQKAFQQQVDREISEVQNTGKAGELGHRKN